MARTTDSGTWAAPETWKSKGSKCLELSTQRSQNELLVREVSVLNRKLKGKVGFSEASVSRRAFLLKRY